METWISQITLDDVYEYIEKGSSLSVSEDLKNYMILLEQVDGMIRRIDKYGSKMAVIKHLITTKGISRYEANKIYDEAIEYFWNDAVVSKESWKNFYANILDEEINYVRQTKETPQDSKVVKDLVDAVCKIRGVYEPDKEELPEELFKPRNVVYTTKAEDLGLPKANRNKIKELIETKLPELTEAEKQRIYQEADIVPFEVFPKDENPRKS